MVVRFTDYRLFYIVQVDRLFKNLCPQVIVIEERRAF